MRTKKGVILRSFWIEAFEVGAPFACQQLNCLLLIGKVSFRFIPNDWADKGH